MNQSATSDVAFVRKDMLPEKTAPIGEVGLLFWLRKNMFSSWLNGAMSIAALTFIYICLRGIVPWLIAPTWNADNLIECYEILLSQNKTGEFSGACWGVIRARWLQLLFGFYPADAYWRPILSLVLLVVAIAPVLFSGVPRKMLWFSALYPLIMVWLLWGGNIWIPMLVIAGLGVVYGVFYLASRFMGELFGIIISVLAAIVWMFALPSINASFNAGFTSLRMDSATITAQNTIDEITPQIAELEQTIISLTRQIDADVVVKDRIVEEIEATHALLHDDTQTDAQKETHSQHLYVLSKDLRAQLAMMVGIRTDRVSASGKMGLLDKELRAAKKIVSAIATLPARIAELPVLQEQASAMRDALPSEYQGIDELGDIPEKLDPDLTQRIIGTVEADAKYQDAKLAIHDDRALIGLVGIRPVESRVFGGFMLSLVIGITGIAMSLPIGIVLALGRQSNLLIVKSVCVGFIEFIRGVPLITLLFVASTLLNYFLPRGTSFDIILRVIIMVTLFASAYMAEVIRGGLAALPKGQYEGADSLGLNYWQATRLIIMPQALKISIPSIVSTFIGLFKDTTLVSIIALLDPIGLSTNIRADQAWNGIIWELYGFIAVVFWILCFSMSRYSIYLEQKLKTSH